MPKRILFAPAVLSLLVALSAVLLTTRSSLAQRASDDCVTRPGSTAPQGSHWYYRYDRANARQCWYLGPEGTKVVSAPPVHREPALVLRLPSPRPEFLPAGADAYASAEPFVSAGARPATGTGFADAAASFAQRWPRSAPAPGTSERVAFGNGTATDADALIIGGIGGQAGAEEQDGLPLIWPVLSAEERAAARTPRMTALDRMLLLLAAVLALSAMVGRVLFRCSEEELGRVRGGARVATLTAPRGTLR
jgi:hypothetical protein